MTPTPLTPAEPLATSESPQVLNNALPVEEEDDFLAGATAFCDMSEGCESCQ